MRKQALLRAAVGFPTGIAIGQAICVLLSLFWGQGRYLACMPQLIEALGDEARAVAVQTLVCGVIGSACAAGSIIWQLERWSLLRQTIVSFALLSGAMLPAAYLMGWMEHTFAGVATYAGVFAGIFAAVWVVQFFLSRRAVKAINRRLRRAGAREGG